MASFASATFRYRGNNGQTFPIWDKPDILTIKDRPNADPVMREVGMDVQRLAVVIRCTKTELIALYAKVLASGSLVLGWETHNAFLEGISGAIRVVSGIDQYEATLHMIRL